MKNTELTRLMDSLASRREPFALATVVNTEGSTIGKPGFKVMISKDGGILYGSLGGVCPESALVATAKKTLATGQPKKVKVYLEDVESAVEGVVKSQSEDEIHVETNCGGMMEIYVEPYLPQQRLVLIGEGGKDDVEDLLVKQGKMLDFEVVVIDHSPVISEQPDELIKDVDFDLSKFKFYDSDSVVVLTHGARDVESLEALSKSKLRYVGLMASRQRATDDIEGLRKRGVDKRFIESLRTPIGADIGAITPAEIAFSIMAEVIAVKYGKTIPGRSLAANSVQVRQAQPRPG
ncbi:MAG TPA: XdhC family protein [Nitrososphaerales archaeon]|nr:XdhC family protein [Nitrososphaerales archaeon]